MDQLRIDGMKAHLESLRAEHAKLTKDLADHYHDPDKGETPLTPDMGPARERLVGEIEQIASAVAQLEGELGNA